MTIQDPDYTILKFTLGNSSMQVDLMTMFETGSDPIIQDSMCNSCCLD